MQHLNREIKQGAELCVHHDGDEYVAALADPKSVGDLLLGPAYGETALEAIINLEALLIEGATYQSINRARM